MRIVLKSGSLKLLDPSGPVQACNGIALPLPFVQWVIEVWPAQVLFWSRIYVGISLTRIIRTNPDLITIAINFAYQMSKIRAEFATGITIVIRVF